MIQKIFGLKHVFSNDDPYDFSAIDSLDEFKSIVASATVIAFTDINAKGGGVVFGREMLCAISHKVIPPQEKKVAVFGIDASLTSIQLERLLAATLCAKGFYEWGN